MHCIVLHIGIYLYWTNFKKINKSCVCFQHAKHDQTLMLPDKLLTIPKFHPQLHTCQVGEVQNRKILHEDITQHLFHPSTFKFWQKFWNDEIFLPLNGLNSSYNAKTFYFCTSPVRAQGVKSRLCPPYPQRDRKRRLNGVVCRNHCIKRVVPCRCLDGHFKELCEMSMALGARP